MYDLVHCPLCGSTEIFEKEEDLNYENGFWWSFLLGPIAGLFISKYGDKNKEYYCQSCNCHFSIL